MADEVTATEFIETERIEKIGVLDEETYRYRQEIAARVMCKTLLEILLNPVGFRMRYGLLAETELVVLGVYGCVEPLVVNEVRKDPRLNRRFISAGRDGARSGDVTSLTFRGGLGLYGRTVLSMLEG